MAVWDNVLFLFLGWFLGLLSPVIVEEIRKRREKHEVALGLRTELKEIKWKLMCTVWLMANRFGSYDRELLNWFEPIVEEYSGVYSKDNILVGIKSHLKLSDEELAALSQYGKAQSGGGVSLKKYQLPFLESKIGSLTIFDEKLQNGILEIRAQLTVLNEEMDEARFYFEKTFDSSVSEGNYEIICESLENCYRNVGRKAKQIVDHISKLPTI